MTDSPELPLHPAPPPPNQRKKKTRDLPNFSDCHCCNRRINITNRKNSLRILTSEWRIVLLCKSCHILVESSQYCSYCLTCVSSSSIDSLFECKRCHRRIHRNCVSRFSLGPGNGGDFSVCFDCWVPELLENGYIRARGGKTKKKVTISGDSSCLGSYRVYDSQDKGKSLEEMVNEANILAQKEISCFDCRVPELLENDNNRARGSTNKKKVKTSGDSSSLGSYRVYDSQDEAMSLEEMVNEANVVAQKKISLTVEVKEKVSTKAVAARRAMERATGALGFVAIENGGDRGCLAVEDDAQLAIRLHRVMNISPRIARNSCLLNTNSTNVPVLGNSSIVGVGGDANKVDIDYLSCRELSELCSTEIRQDCEQRTGVKQDEKGNEESNGCLITYKRRRRASQYVRCKEVRGNCFLRMYARRLSHVKRHNAEHGHCFKTYSRRPSAISHCKNKLQYGGFNFEHELLTLCVTLNCCEESRAFDNTS